MSNLTARQEAVPTHPLYKGYYLCTIRQGEVVSLDGSHSRKTGVVKAKVLIQTIGLNTAGDTYGMVKVPKDYPCLPGESWVSAMGRFLKEKKSVMEEVPEKKVKINEKAANFMGKIVREYRGKR